MPILEELISPITLKEFSENYLYKNPYAAPLKAAKFKHLINWILIDEILALGHADCWLARHGQLPEDPSLSMGRLNLEAAVKNFRSGYTLLVRHAEKAHPAIANVADDFYQYFGVPVDVQLYCTPQSEVGFDWHYDAEDVFVLQSMGEKEFRLKKNTIHPRPASPKLPKDLHFELEPPTHEIRCHLKAGDWLYIPAGWWHKAQAVSDSFHLSVGVMALDRQPNVVKHS
jgi:ribosomal protein L16 Arg81 hydroxylase